MTEVILVTAVISTGVTLIVALLISLYVRSKCNSIQSHIDAVQKTGMSNSEELKDVTRQINNCRAEFVNHALKTITVTNSATGGSVKNG